MIGLPAVEDSRAILIGAHIFQALDDLPAVERNLSGLRNVFTNQTLWGLRHEHCILLLQPESARLLLDKIQEVAVQATDTLVIYYAGHGLRDPYTDELCLALPDSAPDRPYTSLRYEYLRRLVLDPAVRARRKVVILDCCYSGAAMLGGMGAAGDIADQAMVDDGTYILAASAETRRAVAPQGEKYTAFTGELISTLSAGIPNGPRLLDMNTVYRHLHQRLIATSRPAPQQRNRNAGGIISLVRNAAWAAGTAEASAIVSVAPVPISSPLEQIYSGVELVVPLIARTLGPAGRLATVSGPNNRLTTTADPVAICAAISAPDSKSELGVDLIRTLVYQMRDQYSDGSATAAVMPEAMMRRVLSLLTSGENPTRLGSDLLRMTEEAVEELNRRATRVETLDELTQALIVATADRNTGKILAEAANRIGRDGLIDIEEHNNPQLELDIMDGGLLYPCGSPARFDSYTKSKILDPLIIVLDAPRTESDEKTIAVITRNQSRPVVILSPSLENDAIVASCRNPNYRVTILVKNPLKTLGDIAVCTGAQIANLQKGGTAKYAAISPIGLYIHESGGASSDIETRVRELKDEIKLTNYSDRREQLKIRLCRLAGLQATVWIGRAQGETESDFQARKQSLIRARNILPLLIEQGFVAGGGGALHAAGKALNSLPASAAKSAFQDGLSAPLRHIINNNGYSPDSVIQTISATPGATGFDLIDGRVADPIELGILDAAAVITAALSAATATTIKFLRLA